MTQITLTFKKDITKEVFVDTLQEHEDAVVRVDAENLKQFSGAGNDSLTFDASKILHSEPLKGGVGTILFLNPALSGLNSVAETRIALATFNVRVLIVKETIGEIKSLITCSMLLESLFSKE